MKMTRFTDERPSAASPIFVLYEDSNEIGADLTEYQLNNAKLRPNDTFTWLRADILTIANAPLGGLRLYRDEGRGEELSAHEYAALEESGRWAYITDIAREQAFPNGPYVISGSDGSVIA